MNRAKQLVSLCKKYHLTLSSCESLTAGLFTSTIASIPGASAVLKGGLVTYFTPMKSVLAHVDVDLIQKYGVISEECAYAMAKKHKRNYGCGLLYFIYRQCWTRCMGRKTSRKSLLCYCFKKSYSCVWLSMYGFIKK